MDFTPEKSFSSNYTNFQHLLTAAAVAEMGGTPPHPLTENHQKLLPCNGKKRADISVFGQKYLFLGGIFP